MLKLKTPVAPQETNWQSLLTAARDGCDNSLGQILDDVHSYLTLCADRNLGANLRAKFGPSDIVQISMMEAQQSFDSFIGNSEPEMRSWLKRIVLNNLLDESRRYTQTRSRSINKEQPIADAGDWLLADNATGSSIFRKQEQDEQLANAMARLPMRLQQIVEARHRFGYSFRQLATHMSVTEWAARSEYREAIDRLNRWLAEANE